MKKSYRIIFPDDKADFETEWKQCLKKLDEKTDDTRFFKLVIFVSANNYQQYQDRYFYIKGALEAYFVTECPAFTVLVQPPENRDIVIEAGYVDGPDIQVTYKSAPNIPYVVLEGAGFKEIWGCGLGNWHTSDSVEEDSVRAFESMLGILNQEGMVMDQVVRQWNYIGEILKVEKREDKEIQNYQVFNEIRNRYYRKHRQRQDFPSATGIGTKFPGVSVDFCAVDETSDEVESIAVGNDKQQDPYAYGQEVLIGSALNAKAPKQPPQFERARLLHLPVSSTLFLSGTASIIGQETVGVGDVVKQTHVTIDHLQTLAAQSNVMKFASQRISNEGEWKLLRAYVKNKEDFSVVRQICSERFPSFPAVFVQADICRDNLLVEIEGELGFEN